MTSLSESLISLLQDFTHNKNIKKGRCLHAKIIKTGLRFPFVANSLVNLYLKCGSLNEAKLQFEEIQIKDVVSWNCIITGCSKQGLPGSSLALELFYQMRKEDTSPNSFTLAGVFTSASNLSSASVGKQAHCLSIKTPNCSDVFVGSSLLNMYCKSGLVCDARKVFEEMPEKNFVSWASMISGYASVRNAVEALELFKLMRLEEEEQGLNEFVFTSVLSSLSSPELVENGRQIHCLGIKVGMLSFVSVGNALVTMYAKCENLDCALDIFESLSDKNSITWSAMITGYAQSGDSSMALQYFSKMQLTGFRPSEFTLVGILNACSDVTAIREGKQVHCYLAKLGFESHLYIRTALINMYAKCGVINDAWKCFDQLQEPNAALWSSMIGGYVQNGANEEALSLYGRMQMKDILPSESTMGSVLKACSVLAALEQGKQIHARTIKHGLDLEVSIGGALLTMYAKCGNVDDSKLVFRRMRERTVVSWNAMINGLSENGHGHEALQLFEEMKLNGTKPDNVTFVNILSACSHLGLVDKGWCYFKSMVDDFGIEPELEHFGCMVDLLGRCGKLQEAKIFIESASIDHEQRLWHILLGSCRKYRNFEIGVYAGEKLMELGSKESSVYILVSNMYADEGKWEDMKRIRELMRLRGIHKKPGYSWI
ncbi:hypothetical protein MKW94_013719 [Papaver nudicaule]|uniref:Pentatricopeptide repeat-containing protein n=1 Tax=Papaver nudicaule TaxID=74823 RepID=A0AA41RY36_PAPNU|nr:hypothetical protein [Papaver nudicaule]